jgi:hypothetical protein
VWGGKGPYKYCRGTDEWMNEWMIDWMNEETGEEGVKLVQNLSKSVRLLDKSLERQFLKTCSNDE